LIRIGTSGWHYAHWQGRFYPEELRKDAWLGFYTSRLDTVELNSSFYHLPAEQTFQNWREATPPGFLFAVKASRVITHRKKLKDARESALEFIQRAEGLGEKLGPILFQLPPGWHANLPRLAEFLDGLPEARRYAFEFRDPSWFQQPVYDLLRRRNMAFCIYHLAGELAPCEVTADFVYIRLHGPGGKYQGSYDAETLAGWAKDISAWSQVGLDVFCYFDNDQAAYAAQNALALKELLSG
jgi:uncharacterized protein YecE (DUF72 family)